ncbi:MAG TPA: hypothetical protein VMF58_16745 [Rhizomicrobium sp.]|nr:hypothetical protein [Rhizomicrobium sp.]
MTANLTNPVKLVIWDLDDTFWRGALAEEGITPIPSNVEIVRELSRRGIVSAICSKNEFEPAKTKLIELEIWDHFIFPSIDLRPKGKAIASIVEEAALRPDNVLFLDDNPSNREEAKFFNPDLMVADPADLLDRLLDHPHLAGKPDPEMTRLKQYQLLERKVNDKSKSNRSNEAFLRSCDIQITIDHNVDAHFDRIVELINRTNQLNYTKIRLHTPEDIAAFRETLNAFTYQAGCVRVSDKYGDYGLVGFFLLQRRASINKLIHFVFSCRTMHMGVEQYVYERLGSPEIDIVPPTSYGLRSHSEIDWIAADNLAERAERGDMGRKVVLVGGCDLLQLTSFCSGDRLEFVNRAQDTGKARFEDPGFIMGDRAAIRSCEILRTLPSWNYEDVVQFDRGINYANLILLSMWPAMNGDVYLIDGSVRVRLAKKQLAQFGGAKRKIFREHFEKLELSEEERLMDILASIETVAKRSPWASIFVLGAYTKGEMNNAQITRRRMFNEGCREFCARRPRKLHYVDIDALISPEQLLDKTHFTRAGYLALAGHILDRADAPAVTKRPDTPSRTKPKPAPQYATQPKSPVPPERSTSSGLRNMLGVFVSRITG